MRGELYDYNGEMMTQAQIASLENINRATLSDWYKRTGNMQDAVTGAKKSLAQRNIPYYDEILSLKAISAKEKIKFESLKENFEATGNIYEAVLLTKKTQLKRNGSILYNGKMMSLTAIAELEEIDRHSLTKNYEKTNDIYEAVRLTKQLKEKYNGDILYKGQMMTISGIANLEGIKKETLKEFYELYADIEKAVFITKESQLRRKKAVLRGKEATYGELSRYLDISPIKIDRLVNSGVSVEDIEKKVNEVNKRSILEYNGESLYRYCLDNSYNYWVIYYMVNNFPVSVEEAVAAYLENGQQVPTKWIYEKYNVLFKHLMLKFGIDSNRVIKIMKEECATLEEAITKLIFVSNNEKNDFKQIEIEWMFELYEFLTGASEEERKEAENVFFISKRELKFLTKKGNLIEEINRHLLLFEFAVIVDEWDFNDYVGMLELYGITDEEIITIFTELYKPFDEKVINPSESCLQRKEYINNLITNENISEDMVFLIDDITLEEKEMIRRKKHIIERILEARKEENKIL